ncbi:type-1 angiotensin ii receptor [Plakobranchus ocellatus]|uniref:Type-1 angiotensin ii receptor n=1 Tax=Plakobranchus ocellatus TaxID=259542 RepID=A0AAV4B1H0_9GAST|nr:type-1 angiotensin ii receptor [Plakobranchus ocellatus]
MSRTSTVFRATMSLDVTSYTSILEGADVTEAAMEFPTEDALAHLDNLLLGFIVPIISFSILGLATNITNIIVFIKMGLQETTTISMLALAVSDFICCLLSLWTYVCYIPAFRDLPNLPFNSVEVSMETGVIIRPFFTRTGALITAYITLERCLCVVLPMKVKTIITTKVTRITMVIIYLITLLPYISHQFQATLGWKFYPHLNRTMIGTVHVNDPVASVALQVNTFVVGFFYLLLASVTIFVCTTFLVITLARNSKWRESVSSQTRPSSSSDESGNSKPSGSRKENRLMKMVVAIALLFIFCHIPAIVSIFLATFSTDFFRTGRYGSFIILLSSIQFAFEVVNNSLNFFLYYMMGTKFKGVFRQMVGLARKTVSS